MKSRLVQLLCAALLTCLVFGALPARANNTFRLDLTDQNEHRYLGSVPAGTITTVGLNLYVDDPATHARILGLEVAQHENSLREGIGLVLPVQEFSLGMNVPATARCGLRIAMTQQTFVNDEPFASFGLYPYHDWTHGQIEVGLERDQEHTDFAFVQGKWNAASNAVFYGASTERFEQQRATLERYRFERVGAGYLLDATRSRVQGFVGANINGDIKQTTWNVGFSHYASLSDPGVNPAFLLSFRHKPESDYGLALFTLGGRSINSHVSSAIQEAFFRGGLKSSRIIGSRYFDTPGVGNSYQMQDFGLVSIAASLLSVQAGTTAKLVSRDVSGYGTYPGTIGPVMNPFIGVTWNEFSDLVYDPVQHRLDDPVQRYWIFKAGGKVRLGERADSRNQLGYLRVGVEVNTHGSVLGKSTVWF